MTDKPLKLATYAFVTFVVAFVLAINVAPAEECPANAKSCKVLVITPDEEETLKAMIMQTGIEGSFSQIAKIVNAWLDKIQKAPAGEMPKATPDKK